MRRFNSPYLAPFRVYLAYGDNTLTVSKHTIHIQMGISPVIIHIQLGRSPLTIHVTSTVNLHPGCTRVHIFNLSIRNSTV